MVSGTMTHHGKGSMALRLGPWPQDHIVAADRKQRTWVLQIIYHRGLNYQLGSQSFQNGATTWGQNDQTREYVVNISDPNPDIVHLLLEYMRVFIWEIQICC